MPPSHHWSIERVRKPNVRICSSLRTLYRIIVAKTKVKRKGPTVPPPPFIRGESSNAFSFLEKIVSATIAANVLSGRLIHWKYIRSQYSTLTISKKYKAKKDVVCVLLRIMVENKLEGR